ncbi:MAG: N-acetyltransferase [Haloferacaceae archaeon]
MRAGSCEAGDFPDDVTVRAATPADLLGVVRVLDAAALQTDPETIEDRLHAEPSGAFVAVASGGEDGDRDGPTAAPVVGALVLGEGDRFPDSPGTVWIESVAVRRRRQNRGVGRALVDAACTFAIECAPADAVPRLLATFDDDARPFYEACGFEILDPGDVGDGEPVVERKEDGIDAGSDDGRLRGLLTVKETWRSRGRGSTAGR